MAWADFEQRELGRKAKALIERLWTRSEVAVCAMSFWEAALIEARSRLELPAKVAERRGQLLAARRTTPLIA